MVTGGKSSIYYSQQSQTLVFKKLFCLSLKQLSDYKDRGSLYTALIHDMN